MKIEATTDFKHNKGHFKEGEKYTVPDTLGQYFVNVGWAKARGVQAGSDRTPPGQFFVEEDFTVLEDEAAAERRARGRAPSGDLEIQDSESDQNTEV
jgi:hypothetical protein